MTEHTMAGLASLPVLGIGMQWLAWRLRLPAILLLLLCGLLAGPATGFLNPDALLGGLLLPVVSVSVGLILFEGGLSLHLRLDETGGLTVYTTDKRPTPRSGQALISLVHPAVEAFPETRPPSDRRATGT
jgi:hypothetical protein